MTTGGVPMRDLSRGQSACLPGRLRAVPAFLLALTLAAPVTGAFATDNVIGIFTDTTSFVSQINPPPGEPFDIYFMLMSPRTAEGDAVAAIDGFEYRVMREGPEGSMFRLADTLPKGWFNLRDASDSDNASYMAGGATPVPVTGDAAHLQTWTLLSLSSNVSYFFLQPVHLPTLPGVISFTYPGASGSVSVAAVPASLSLEFPVFCTHCFMIDPVTKQTFGEIKALYR